MVDAALIQEKINYGLGIVGVKVGSTYAWYRPGLVAGSAIQAGNLMQVGATPGAINALVTPTPSLAPGPIPTSRPDLYAALDPTLVLPGDYLIGQGMTYFVGAFLPLAGISHLFQCNETFALARDDDIDVGPQYYGGANASNTVLARGFPGWMKAGDRRQPSNLHLPGEVQMATVNVLLPITIAGQIIRGDQLITSETIQSRWEVQSADLTTNCYNILAIERSGVIPNDTTQDQP